MTDPEYFTLAEFRALMPDMSSSVTYPDSSVVAAAAYVTAVIERFVGTSFVGRAYTETYDGGDSAIVLRQPFVQSISSVTENGVTVSDSITFRDGVLEHKATGSYGAATTWLSGRRNISVTYTAGYSTSPPADIKEAAMVATRFHLLALNSKTAMSDRATSITNEFGNVQLSTASKDRPFGLPEVDAVLTGWRDDLDVFGFA